MIKISFTEKIDVLDLLINIIAEHEAKLSLIVEKLEDVSRALGIEVEDELIP